MFINNSRGDFLRAKNIVAVKIFKGDLGTCLYVYSEDEMIPLHGDGRNIIEVRNALLSTLEQKFGLHFLQIGEYHIVVEAINAIDVDFERVKVTTNKKSFIVYLSEDQDEDFVAKSIADQLPILHI